MSQSPISTNKTLYSDDSFVVYNDVSIPYRYKQNTITISFATDSFAFQSPIGTNKTIKSDRDGDCFLWIKVSIPL